MGKGKKRYTPRGGKIKMLEMTGGDKCKETDRWRNEERKRSGVEKKRFINQH